MTFFAAPGLLLLTLLLLCVTNSSSLLMPGSKELRELLSRYEQDTSQKGASGAAANRSRRAILWSDREEILQLHNKLRGNVYPSAADMEHMVRPGFFGNLTTTAGFTSERSNFVKTRLVMRL